MKTSQHIIYSETGTILYVISDTLSKPPIGPGVAAGDSPSISRELMISLTNDKGGTWITLQLNPSVLLRSR